MTKFSKFFNQKTDWFKACATLCYLIEAQVRLFASNFFFFQLLSKFQRIVAFYILYEAYRYEPNVQATGTPFEAVVYSSLMACMQTNERLGNKTSANTSLDETQPIGGSSINNLGTQLGQALPVGTQTLLTSSAPNSISADFNYRAEYRLLTDILVSVPKVSFLTNNTDRLKTIKSANSSAMRNARSPSRISTTTSRHLRRTCPSCLVPKPTLCLV